MKMDELTFEKSEEVQRWMGDMYHAAIRSRNRAYLLSAILLVTTLAAVFAVASLAPLKEVQTKILLVDSVHGVVTSVKAGEDLAQIEAKYAIAQSMLYRYVIARETYDPADFQIKYDLVRGLSSNGPRAEYEHAMKLSNKNSPVVVMGKSGKRTVKVLSVSKLNDSTSQIRFSTQDWFNGTARAPQFWVAIATYHFVSTPKTLDDRLENPLGFTVDGYRVDQESSMPTDINNEASQ